MATTAKSRSGMLGDLKGPTAAIRPRGTISASDGAWRLEWGAGADDRWHVAHDEVAVRQSRIDDTPVYSTAMRVPGGDVVCRVGSATDGMSRSLTIEFVNSSPGGVALGVVLHVAPPAGRSRRSRRQVLSVNRSGVELGHRVLLSAQRRAGGVVAMATPSDDPADAWAVVEGSPDSSEATAELDSTGGFAAMVFPVPHRASLSIRLSLEGQLSSRVSTPADIASGWRTVTAGAATVQVPDPRMVEAWRRVVPDLVIAAGSPDPLEAAEAVPWLDLAGLHEEADRARATIIVAAEAGRLKGRAAAAAITALASRELRAGEPSGLCDLVDLLALSAGDSVDRPTLTGAALALQSTASSSAIDLLQMAASLPDSPTLTPTSAVARGAAAILGPLIGPMASVALDLLPDVPTDWFGQSVDIRGLATHVGRVSFSLRWHGARPALLWEREDGPSEAVVTCSGLDPAWSSFERSGEALLSEPKMAG